MLVQPLLEPYVDTSNMDQELSVAPMQSEKTGLRVTSRHDEIACLKLTPDQSAPLYFYKKDATLVEATGKHGQSTYRPPARHTRSPYP